MDRKNGDNSVHYGKKRCPYCNKRFQRLDMHQSWCTLRPQDEKDYKNEAKGLSSSDDEDDDDGKKRCPYCNKRFQRLDMHQPQCTLRPQDEKDYKNEAKGLSSSDDEDDDDGKKPCPYCHKRFQRLDKHQSWCTLRSQEEKDFKNAVKELSSSDDEDDDDDGKKPCPYCHKRFQRLDKHQSWCTLRSQEEKDFKNAVKALSSSDDEDDGDDGKKPCPYCHKRFQRLDKHQSWCTLRSQEEKDFKNAVKALSSSDDEDDDDDGKKPCPYCHKRFQRLDKHQSWCTLRSQEEKDFKNAVKALSSSDDEDDDDDGKKPCPYCHKRFQRLDKHQSWCTLRSQEEKDFKNAVKALSSSDDEDDDDDGKKPCPYCHKRFQRLDKHQSWCTLRSQEEKDFKNAVKALSSSDDEDDDDDGKKPCPYCHKRFQRLDKHQSWCTLRSQEEKDFKNAVKALSSSDDEDDDDDDGKKPCPYCHKRFQRLDKHQSWCKLKPQEEKDYKTAASGHSSFDDKYNDDKAKLHSSLKQNEKEYVFNSAMDVNVALQSSFEEEVSTVLENQEYESSSKLKKRTEARKHFQNFQKKVQLKQKDIHNNVKMNDLMENVMKELNVCRPLKWKKLNSGSYYSYVKVSKPNEFDYLLCSTLVKCRIVQHSSSPNYCRVFVTNRKKLPLDFRDLLGPDDELSPSKFKEYVFKVFDLCLNEMNNRRLVKMSTGSTCPAYTVEYKYGSQITYSVDIDWIPCLEVEDKPHFCMEWKTKKLTDEEKMDTEILVVPKNLASNGDNLELWRLSYSTFEKKIIREKCKKDDRKVIRILKNIVADENDHNSKIGSYHITNHCLHMFEEIGQRPDLREYTVQAIDSFISRLQSRDLPNFFISSINLLQNVDEKECLKMIEKMKKYREQWTDK